MLVRFFKSRLKENFFQFTLNIFFLIFFKKNFCLFRIQSLDVKEVIFFVATGYSISKRVLNWKSKKIGFNLPKQQEVDLILHITQTKWPLQKIYLSAISKIKLPNMSKLPLKKTISTSETLYSFTVWSDITYYPNQMTIAEDLFECHFKNKVT